MNIFFCVSREKECVWLPKALERLLVYAKGSHGQCELQVFLVAELHICVFIYICMSRPGKSCFTDLFAQELIPWGLSLPATCIIILIDRKSKGEIPIPRALCASETPPDQPERGRHQHPHQDQSPWSNPSLQALQVARGRQRSVRLTSWARRSSGLPFTQRQSHQS